jgi:hypothetical protein
MIIVVCGIAIMLLSKRWQARGQGSSKPAHPKIA